MDPLGQESGCWVHSSGAWGQGAPHEQRGEKKEQLAQRQQEAREPCTGAPDTFRMTELRGARRGLKPGGLFLLCFGREHEPICRQSWHTGQLSGSTASLTGAEVLSRQLSICWFPFCPTVHNSKRLVCSFKAGETTGTRHTIILSLSLRPTKEWTLAAGPSETRLGGVTSYIYCRNHMEYTFLNNTAPPLTSSSKLT